MRYEFVRKTLASLIERKTLSTDGSILAVCASRAEQQVFQDVGFTRGTISNLDDRMNAPDFCPFDWSYQNAQALTFPDEAFDYVFVSDGLHHCDSPHSGLLEMYRVAKRAVVVFESRDSTLMRIANRLGLSSCYEVAAVLGSGLSHGGVNNSEIPNFVYRWTEREFEKTINSFLPIGRHRFHYFYGLNLPESGATGQAGSPKSEAIKILSPIVKLLGQLVPKQCNSFCMVAEKPRVPADLWPWLTYEDGKVRFRTDYQTRDKA